MSNFDLNIQNYTQSELQEIFDLKTGYQMNQLLDNEAKLIESIKKDAPEVRCLLKSLNPKSSIISPNKGIFSSAAPTRILEPSSFKHNILSIKECSKERLFCVCVML